MNEWIEFTGLNVPSSKNSKTWTGKILIKSKLCQQYIKWAEPLFKAQKDEWEKMKQEHTERPLMVGMYFYRDSKRKFDFNNVSQILCDMMTANNYIVDDNINEMIPVYLGHEVVKKEQSGVKLSIVNMEIWKDIPDYPKYQVSNMGNVRSLKYDKVKLLRPCKCKDDYLQLELCKDGKRKHFLVHRLVYEAFVGAIPEGMQVNHINEDKTDNRLENLNLMTCIENNNWGTRNKRISEKMTNGKLSKCVYQYTLDGVLVKIWLSAKECGRNGFDQGAVSKCCCGKLKQYKGFLWSYTKL